MELQKKSRIPNRLILKTIPRTGEKIPAIGLGTYSVFDVGSSVAERGPLREVLRLFADSGGTLIDSSPMYGQSESVVGQLAEKLGLRARLFLATKVWTTGKEAGIRQMNASFRLMRTGLIDLMQVHNLADWEVHLRTIREWKEQGKVRYSGISHYTAGAYDMVESVRSPLPHREPGSSAWKAGRPSTSTRPPKARRAGPSAGIASSISLISQRGPR